MTERRSGELNARQIAVLRVALRNAVDQFKQVAVGQRLGVAQGHVSRVLGGKAPGVAMARAMIEAGWLSGEFWSDSPERALIAADAPRPILVSPAQVAQLEQIVDDLKRLVSSLKS